MKLEEFDNKHHDKDCVILSCGPSLKEYSKEQIKDFCKDKIVICVKEAVFEFEDIADYLAYNSSRIRHYPIRKDIIKIYAATKNREHKNCDLFLREIPKDKKEKQLLKCHEFHEYNLRNKHERLWGPGIMYEYVFYLCLYMGIKNVYTIGWDLIDTSKTSRITHFFEREGGIYKGSKRFGGTNYKDEMILVNKNIPYMYDYFKSQNMFIHVVGEKSFVNRHIPRISL